MKNFLLALIMITALVACGSNGSVPPSGTPTFVLTWNGVEHSLAGRTTSSLRTLGLTLSEPIAFGASEVPCSGCLTLGDNGTISGNNSVIVTVQETNNLGTPIPVSNPALTVNASLATATGPFTNTATLSSIQLKSTTQPGIGNLTVTADGFTQTLAVQVLPNLAMSVASTLLAFRDAPFSAFRFDANGNAIAVTDTSTADVYASLAANGNPSGVRLPYGYQNLSASGLGISSANAAPVAFVSQGTTISGTMLVNSTLNPTSYFVFKTALGKYVYFSTTSATVQGSNLDASSEIGIYGSYKVF